MAPATGRRLLDALDQRVPVADGALGPMFQDAGERGDLVLDDFAGLEGRHGIRDGTRPDAVRHIHRARSEAGADAVGTSAFGANRPHLADHDVAGRIREPAGKGTAPARGVELSEELQPHPEESTDALAAHHPEAKYSDAG